MITLGGWGALALGVLAASPSAVARAGLAAPAPWLTPGLAADPKAVALAAKAYVPAPGDDMEALDEEVTFRFDAQGRLTRTRRQVRLVISNDAVEGASVLRVPYEPWHEQRPEIRARVITPDGQAHALDPTTLIDSVVGQGAGPMFSDVRVVTCPLPAVQRGAVIEEETVHRDVAPFFSAGGVYTFDVGRAARVERTVITLDYPVALPVKYALRGLAAAPAVRAARGRRTLRWELGRLPGYPDVEIGAPGEVLGPPRFEVSTGASWAQVARAYQAVVDAKLAASPALAGLAKTVIGPASTPDQALAKVAAWMPRTIRYTGLELGEGSIIPAAPSQTLARQYGDCKDMAVLAVGLLRAAGFAADVALVQVRPPDLDPDLPGLGHFDHAIVFVPGAQPRWYDATYGLTPPGELPAQDQDRPALIIAGETRGVVRTPVQTAAENRFEVEVTYRMAEVNAAQVTVRETLRGAAGRAWRAVLAGVDAAAARQRFGEVQKGRFLAERVARVTTSDPLAVDQPLQISVSLEASRRAATGDAFASAAILRLPVVGAIGEYLGDLPADDPPRTQPFLSMEATEAVWTYRVIPPPGFTLRALPPDRTRALGPATLSESLRLERDGSATVVLRFHAPRRFSAAEFNAMRAAYTALRAEPGLTIEMDRTGAKDLAEGRVREGLAEYQALAALHPKEALHESQLAMALLSVGMREPARAHARRAVALQPGWAPGHRILGFVLDHDVVGRDASARGGGGAGADPAAVDGGFGVDLAGALAEYREAERLDATDVRAHQGALQALFEMAAAAPEVDRGGLLEAAAAECQTLRGTLKDHARDLLYLGVLLRLGRYGEVEALAPTLPTSAPRDAAWLAAAAHLHGKDDLRALARRWFPGADQRGRAAEAAAVLLWTDGAYALAREVRAAVAAGADPSPEVASFLGRLAPVDPATLDPARPEDLLARVAAVALRDHASDPAWGAVLAPGPVAQAARARVTRAVRALAHQITGGDLPPKVALDALVAGTAVTLDPGPEGAVALRCQARTGGPVLTLYAAPGDGGALKVLGVGSDQRALGARALRWAESGDGDRARAWLDWAGVHGGVASASRVFPRFWPAAPGADARQAVLRAAAVLAVGSSEGDRARAVLEAAYASTPPGPERALLALAWLGTQDPSRPDPAVPARLAEAVTQVGPDLALALRMHFAAPDPGARCALVASGAVAALPSDALRTAQLECLAARAGIPAAVAFGQRQLASGAHGAGLLNDLTWAELFLPAAPTDLAALAARAVRARASAATANTAAAAYAESGHLAEAHAQFLKSMVGRESLRGADWLVYGRLAEAYGLVAEARAAYARVAPSVHPGSDPMSPHALAQRWLARLNGAGASAAAGR